MKTNSTQVSYFTLSAYFDTGPFRYFYFLVTLCLYLLIMCSNVLLIVVICVNRSLHEPMYMFLCSLFVNELYGSTGLFPFLLIQILSDVHTVSAPLCFLQVFCLYTYVNVELCTLAVMSYDRYLAICRPLHYNTQMRCKKVMMFIVVTWLHSFVKCIINISLNLRLTLCGNVINSLYCHNYLIAKLACSDISVNNIYGVVFSVVALFLPLFPILFSYTKILRVCFFSSGKTRQKAVSTCTPHLVSLLNFSFGAFFQVLITRSDVTNVPAPLTVFLSLYYGVLQPLLSPVMYGMQLAEIRTACKQISVRRSLQ